MFDSAEFAPNGPTAFGGVAAQSAAQVGGSVIAPSDPANWLPLIYFLQGGSQSGPLALYLLLQASSVAGGESSAAGLVGSQGLIESTQEHDGSGAAAPVNSSALPAVGENSDGAAPSGSAAGVSATLLNPAQNLSLDLFGSDSQAQAGGSTETAPFVYQHSNASLFDWRLPSGIAHFGETLADSEFFNQWSALLDPNIAAAQAAIGTTVVVPSPTEPILTAPVAAPGLFGAAQT